MTNDTGAALFFDPDAYTEAHARTGTPTGPAGLMGRQVAGKEFLDAYLSHARSDTLTAVVRAQQRGDVLQKICNEHPSSRDRQRRLRIVGESDFLPVFSAPNPPADVLYFPCPPDTKYAWGRQGSGARFAISGVTHTLSSASAAHSLCDLLTAPFESFDALICTSKAVVEMVRAVTGAYADYL